MSSSQATKFSGDLLHSNGTITPAYRSGKAWKWGYRVWKETRYDEYICV